MLLIRPTKLFIIGIEYLKQKSTIRNFGTSQISRACDDTNGRSLDITQDVVNNCNNNELSIIQYFDQKEDSIVRYIDDIAVLGSMIDQLHVQRDEVLDIGGFPPYTSDSSE